MKHILQTLCLTTFLASSLHAGDPTQEEGGRAPLNSGRYSVAESLEIEEDRYQQDKKAEEEQKKEGGEEACRDCKVKKAMKWATTHTGSSHIYVGTTFYGDKVELEDGSLWAVRADDRYKLLNWAPGDEISVTPGSWYSVYKYKFYNATRWESIEVDITDSPILESPYLRVIMDINIQRGYLTLNDGSLWELNAADHKVWNKWIIGDIVIIGTNDALFSLFRPNILINVTCSAKYIPSKCIN